jgi:hypothetical protein
MSGRQSDTEDPLCGRGSPCEMLQIKNCTYRVSSPLVFHSFWEGLIFPSDSTVFVSAKETITGRAWVLEGPSQRRPVDVHRLQDGHVSSQRMRRVLLGRGRSAWGVNLAFQLAREKWHTCTFGTLFVIWYALFLPCLQCVILW